MKISALLSVVPSIVSANCFDGNNGGCSHFCAGSVCSCPSCWSLGDDEKTCSIDAGKALVTCKSDGIEVIIDKCVATGVEQNAIHLRHTGCGAIEESESQWKVSTGFSDCGTDIQFVDDKLAIANALMIGGYFEGGLRLTNNHEIGFTCRYNNVASASKSFSAAAETVVFDINEEAAVELSLGFNLQPFETDQFATAADLSTQSVQIGSSIFMRVSPANELPESLEFSVHKCSVEDTDTETEVSILDSCPVFEQLNFIFKNEQSDQNAVDFSFASFQLESSTENAELEMKCDINICPLNSPECLKTCSTPGPSDVYMMVITHQSLSASYIINSDGSQLSDVQITSPNSLNDYVAFAQPAIVADKLHFFGGVSDFRQIVRLDDCTMVKLAAKLTRDFSGGHAALTTDNGQKALICFGMSTPYYDTCDEFDGSTNSATATFSSTFPHRQGGLGYFDGFPTSVGSGPRYTETDGNQKTEMLREDGWYTLGWSDHPGNTHSHALVGLTNGDMLLIGGKDEVAENDSIWRLSAQGEYSWTLIGNLQQAVSWGSAILEGNSVYIIGGSAPSDYFENFELPVQRIDLAQDGTIAQVELIAEHTTSYENPYLLITDADTCATN